MLQCRSGFNWKKRILPNKGVCKKAGKVKARMRTFWKKPKSPMVTRISPKSTIFTLQMMCLTKLVSCVGMAWDTGKYLTTLVVSR